MEENITKTLKITLANQEIINLEITGSKSLVDKIDIDGYEIKKELSGFILNGFKLKAHYIFKDEKGRFVKVDKVLHPEKYKDAD